MKLLITLCFLLFSAYSFSQQPLFPAIKGYGGVYPVPEAEHTMDTTRIYYLLADVTKGADSYDKVAPGLERVARTVNLHVLAGVPLRNIRLVVVVHGSATDAVLGANSYLRTFGYDNPHLRLFDQLEEMEAALYVCGQAWTKRGYEPHQLVPQVKLAHSAMTVLSDYQQQGYHVLDF